VILNGRTLPGRVLPQRLPVSTFFGSAFSGWFELLSGVVKFSCTFSPTFTVTIQCGIPPASINAPTLPFPPATATVSACLHTLAGFPSAYVSALRCACAATLSLFCSSAALFLLRRLVVTFLVLLSLRSGQSPLVAFVGRVALPGRFGRGVWAAGGGRGRTDILCGLVLVGMHGHEFAALAPRRCHTAFSIFGSH